jgi:hypothetical protein
MANHEFYSGNTIGTRHLFFKDSDVAQLWRILDINPMILERDRSSCPNIPDYKIAGDMFNLVIYWLAYKINNSSIEAKLKKAGVIECCLLFNYRTIAALHSNSFRYLCDEAIARATYEALSKRFILKQVKSWQAYMDYRVQEATSPEGIHHETLHNFEIDKKILYIITDTQGRISTTFVHIYRVYVDLLDKEEALIMKSTVEDNFEEKSIAEIYNTDATRVNKIVALTAEPAGFIRPEVVDIIMNINPSMERKTFTDFLYDYSVQSMNNKSINDFTRDMIVWCFNYVTTSTLTYKEKKSLQVTFSYVRNGISSSRSTDVDLHKLRDRGNRLVKRLYKGTEQQVNLVRVALVLYLYLISVTEG